MIIEVRIVVFDGDKLIGRKDHELPGAGNILSLGLVVVTRCLHE